jgi:SulP family sulfate permease
LKASELVVSPERVVRERLSSDPLCVTTILYDFEGDLFFGAAPELDRHLVLLRNRAEEQGIRFIVLRLKRVRNPDAVCLERIEHFLHTCEAGGIVVLLAGVRPDFRAALRNIGFDEWFPASRIFCEEDDVDSATLKAVRHGYNLIGHSNRCPHCSTVTDVSNVGTKLYYLV